MKVIVIGEPGVGKTSLIRRLSANKFDSSYLLTVGMDPTEIQLTDNHERKRKLVLWDIAGQERFRTMREVFYRGAEAAVAVFDLTRPDSLPKLEKWIFEFKSYLISQKPIILLGNKVDMEDYISIEQDAIDKFVKKYDIDYYTATSAKTGASVIESFKKLIE